MNQPTDSSAVSGDYVFGNRYPQDTVGSVMDPHYLSLNQNSTVKEAIEMIRFLCNNEVPILYAYVVDDTFRLMGVLVMRDLLISRDDMILKNVMKPDPYSINVNRKKDEVSKEVLEKGYLAVPIVDDEHHLLGAIKFGDILRYAKEEPYREMQKMFGAGSEESAYSSIFTKITKRLPWLNVNLATAFLAASVIGIFEEMIVKITALAMFLPIVAGQGGNAGAQSLAVVMRSLAVDKMPGRECLRVIFRECAAGVVNGMAIGVVTALCAWFWHHNPFLGLIVGAAITINSLIAVFFGSAIPIVMKRLGMDPAQCSSIILTTFTDVFGFFSLLGLALLFQSKLI